MSAAIGRYAVYRDVKCRTACCNELFMIFVLLCSDLTDVFYSMWASESTERQQEQRLSPEKKRMCADAWTLELGHILHQFQCIRLFT